MILRENFHGKNGYVTPVKNALYVSGMQKNNTELPTGMKHLTRRKPITFYRNVKVKTVK